MTSHEKDLMLPKIQATESKLTGGNVTSHEPNMGDFLSHLMGQREKIEPDLLNTYEIIDTVHTEPVSENINPIKPINSLQTEQPNIEDIPSNLMSRPDKIELDSINTYEIIDIEHTEPVRKNINLTEPISSIQIEKMTVFNMDLVFLFSLNSHEFITAAYSIILERAPDEPGKKYYQQRLSKGISRTEILSQLAASGETEGARAYYKKNRAAYLRLKWRRIPVIGVGFEFITAFTHDHLNELLIHNDEQFVVHAYQTILGQGPDKEGLKHYLALLRAGKNKMSILVDINISKEGKSAGNRVAGLAARSFLHRLRNLPLIKWSTDVLLLPQMVIENLQCTRRIALLLSHNKIQPQAVRESVIVLGAGGHAKVIIEILHALGYQVSYCVGGADSPDECMGIPVLKGDDHLTELRQLGYALLFPAIGSNTLRKHAAARAVSLGYKLINAISPHAIISPSIVLGKGIAIMSGVVINAQSTIEDLAIINTGATVDHDCHIGSCAHVAPQCALAGNVTIGSGAFVGIGTSIIPNRNIGSHSIIGAGSVVISDIPSSLVALGSPARIFYKEQKI